MHKTTDNGGIVLDDVSGRVTEMGKANGLINPT